jgi:hypothetical protein
MNGVLLTNLITEEDVGRKLISVATTKEVDSCELLYINKMSFNALIEKQWNKIKVTRSSQGPLHKRAVFMRIIIHHHQNCGMCRPPMRTVTTTNTTAVYYFTRVHHTQVVVLSP